MKADEQVLCALGWLTKPTKPTTSKTGGCGSVRAGVSRRAWRGGNVTVPGWLGSQMYRTTPTTLAGAVADRVEDLQREREGRERESERMGLEED